MNNKLLTFTALLLFASISSCKKDETKITPKSDCIITSFTYDGDDDEKYDITYDNDLITTFTSASYVDKLFYNSDKLLSHRYYYDENNKLTDVDTLFYDSSKRLTSTIWYSLNKSGKRVFEEQIWYEYNASNQVKTIKDSTNYGFKEIGIHAFEYANNRISKETYSTYENGKFTGKSEFTYTYTTIPNSFYTVLNQSALVFNGDLLFIAEFNNTDLLVSRMDEKYYNEDNILESTNTLDYAYTFEKNNLKSVTVDGNPLMTLNYKCD